MDGPSKERFPDPEMRRWPRTCPCSDRTPADKVRTAECIILADHAIHENRCWLRRSSCKQQQRPAPQDPTVRSFKADFQLICRWRRLCFVLFGRFSQRPQIPTWTWTGAKDTHVNWHWLEPVPRIPIWTDTDLAEFGPKTTTTALTWWRLSMSVTKEQHDSSSYRGRVVRSVSITIRLCTFTDLSPSQYSFAHLQICLHHNTALQIYRFVSITIQLCTLRLMPEILLLFLLSAFQVHSTSFYPILFQQDVRCNKNSHLDLNLWSDNLYLTLEWASRLPGR